MVKSHLITNWERWFFFFYCKQLNSFHKQQKFQWRNIIKKTWQLARNLDPLLGCEQLDLLVVLPKSQENYESNLETLYIYSLKGQTQNRSEKCWREWHCGVVCGQSRRQYCGGPYHGSTWWHIREKPSQLHLQEEDHGIKRFLQWQTHHHGF